MAYSRIHRDAGSTNQLNGERGLAATTHLRHGGPPVGRFFFLTAPFIERIARLNAGDSKNIGAIKMEKSRRQQYRIALGDHNGVFVVCGQRVIGGSDRPAVAHDERPS
jgi:hypothetical protein